MKDYFHLVEVPVEDLPPLRKFWQISFYVGRKGYAQAPTWETITLYEEDERKAWQEFSRLLEEKFPASDYEAFDVSPQSHYVTVKKKF